MFWHFSLANIGIIWKANLFCLNTIQISKHVLHIRTDTDNNMKLCERFFPFLPTWSIYFSHCEWVRGPSSIILSAAVIHLCKKDSKVNLAFVEPIHIPYWCSEFISPTLAFRLLMYINFRHYNCHLGMTNCTHIKGEKYCYNVLRILWKRKF